MNNKHIIKMISAAYNGNIRLQEPLNKVPAKSLSVGAELEALLKISNGIQETFFNPHTKEMEPLGWIIQPIHLIDEDTHFFHSEYGIDGIVFSTDGAGNPYYIKPDGKIYLYECIDNEEICKANSLLEFYNL